MVQCGSTNERTSLKECSAWKEEIRKIWKEVGEATAGQGGVFMKGIYKGRKGFGLRVQGRDGETVRGPGNTSIGVLLAHERCIAAVLSILMSTKYGQVKEGILTRGVNSLG